MTAETFIIKKNISWIKKKRKRNKGIHVRFSNVWQQNSQLWIFARQINSCQLLPALYLFHAKPELSLFQSYSFIPSILASDPYLYILHYMNVITKTICFRMNTFNWLYFLILVTRIFSWPKFVCQFVSMISQWHHLSCSLI